MITNETTIQQGWQCPKCGSIMSPTQSFCPFCAQTTITCSTQVVDTPLINPVDNLFNEGYAGRPMDAI